jgi:hypothetical protein
VVGVFEGMRMITCKECGAANSSARIRCARCEMELRSAVAQFIVDKLDRETRLRFFISGLFLIGAVVVLILIDVLGD